MRKLTQEEFVMRAIAIHGNKYDYSRVKYVNSRTKVEIICPLHGSFFVYPIVHLSRGDGCPLCNHHHKQTKDEFIKKAINVHGNKYDYSIVDYKSSSIKVKIICPIHGIFEQTPMMHLYGQGCPICKSEKIGESRRKTIEDFIQKASVVHGGKYTYEHVVYKDTHSKVLITCQEHGDFYMTPHHHLIGQRCPLCVCKSKGEERIRKYLSDKKINFESQYKLNNENIFSTNKKLVVDFYLPEKNVIIEYNGVQHYKPVEKFGGIDAFNKQIERDFSVKQYCKEHKIKLIEINYKDYNKISIILDKELSGFRK